MFEFILWILAMLCQNPNHTPDTLDCPYVHSITFEMDGDEDPGGEDGGGDETGHIPPIPPKP